VNPDVQPASRQLDFGALLPGLGVFGGVRRFIEIGNEMVRRGHRFVIYHPQGTPPAWLPFLGETRPTASLAGTRHQVLICNNPPQLGEFDKANADLKLFYFALEGIPGERSIARHAGWVIAVNSSGLQQRLRRRYGVDAEKAIGGIDLATFQPPASPRARGGPYRVLVFGRTSRRRKGTALAIRAVESLARSLGPEQVQLVLFDHVESGTEPEPRAHASLDVEYHVNPSQPALAALYASGDVFVSAERRAGWSNTVAEAMACGVPVVCTRSGTLDIAVHKESAWVARWRHPWFLSRGLGALHDDPAMAARLRATALGRIGDFTWARVADQVEEIVRRRLASPASSGAHCGRAV
jgi:glycosyltransferase involved in cell wall biosynthesis